MLGSTHTTHLDYFDRGLDNLQKKQVGIVSDRAQVLRLRFKIPLVSALEVALNREKLWKLSHYTGCRGFQWFWRRLFRFVKQVFLLDKACVKVSPAHFCFS